MSGGSNCNWYNRLRQFAGNGWLTTLLLRLLCTQPRSGTASQYYRSAKNGSGETPLRRDNQKEFAIFHNGVDFAVAVLGEAGEVAGVGQLGAVGDQFVGGVIVAEAPDVA